MFVLWNAYLFDQYFDTELSSDIIILSELDCQGTYNCNTKTDDLVCIFNGDHVGMWFCEIKVNDAACATFWQPFNVISVAFSLSNVNKTYDMNSRQCQLAIW